MRSPSEIIIDGVSLAERIRLHGMWRRCEEGGKRLALIGSDLWKADLSEADLSGATLWRVRLRDSDLSEAALRNARMNGCDLRRARMSGANLSRTNLSRTNMNGIDLSEACLSGAYLRGVSLWNTTGNGREVKSRNGGVYDIAWTNDGADHFIQIGCRQHTLSEWEVFTGAEIEAMDIGTSLDWWRENKGRVLDMVRNDPAVPYRAT